MNQEVVVLIVDDSPVIIKRLTGLVKEVKGVGKVLHAQSFEEGLEVIEQHKTDVVILDINMPGKSGIELLRLINERGYTFKSIIMLTEDNLPLKRDLSLQLGANHYLNKFNDFEMIPDLIIKSI